VRVITAEASAKLQAHDWPGNVRELRHVIRRAALFTSAAIDGTSVEIEATGDGAARMSRAADGTGPATGELVHAAAPVLESDLLPYATSPLNKSRLTCSSGPCVAMATAGAVPLPRSASRVRPSAIG